MVYTKRSINLLSANWKVPDSVRIFAQKLKIVSIIVLGIYVVFTVGLFSYTTYLKVRIDNNQKQIENATAQLAALKSVEAAENILKNKVVYAGDVYKNQFNAGIGLAQTMTLFTPDAITFSDLTLSSPGRLNFRGVASNSGNVTELLSNFENANGLGRQLFSKAEASFDHDLKGQLNFTFTLEFSPKSGRISINTQQ